MKNSTYTATNICFPHMRLSRAIGVYFDALGIKRRYYGDRHDDDDGIRFTALLSKRKYYFYGDFSRKSRAPRLRLTIARQRPLRVYWSALEALWRKGEACRLICPIMYK